MKLDHNGSSLRDGMARALACGSASTESGCVVWTRSKNHYGYGVFRASGVYFYAHRVAYELAIGPIPSGLVIDHLCRNRACVNPAHLEVVTRGENVLRGVGMSVVNRDKTECVRGHREWATYIRGSTGRKYRCCLACKREQMRSRNPATVVDSHRRTA